MLLTKVEIHLLRAEQYAIVYIYHIFSIHSSVDRHLSCFHILVIANSATRNIGVHVPFQIRIFVFSDIYPEVECWGYMVVLFLLFEKTPYCFP